jgi:transcription factor C subunit 7
VLGPHFDDLDQHYDMSTHAPAANGETIVELHERVNAALRRLVAELDDDPGQPRTVLICTHAATMIAVGRVLTGRMPDDPNEDDFQCYTAGVSKFVRRNMEPGKGVVGNWDCELNSETSFLSGGAERGWYANHLISSICQQCPFWGSARC